MLNQERQSLPKRLLGGIAGLVRSKKKNPENPFNGRTRYFKGKGGTLLKVKDNASTQDVSTVGDVAVSFATSEFSIAEKAAAYLRKRLGESGLIVVDHSFAKALYVVYHPLADGYNAGCPKATEEAENGFGEMKDVHFMHEDSWQTIKDRIDKAIVDSRSVTQSSWHKIIEGGILVNIRNSDGVPRTYFLGDAAVYIITDDVEEVERAAEYMKEKYGRSEWLLDHMVNGKGLYFIYRPRSFETAVITKYCEVICVMSRWKGKKEGMSRQEVGDLPKTPLELVRSWIDSSKPYHNDPPGPWSV